MYTRFLALLTATATAAILCAPTQASAQTTKLSTPTDSSSFLVAGMARGAASGGGGGFGIGVKGGLLFSSLNQAGQSYKNNNGWEAGLFFGGNRNGRVGFMADVLYAKKGAKIGSSVLDSYYLEVPVLLRVNIGSSNKNTGAIVYGLAGQASDILLSSKLDGVDVKRSYESLDLGIILGAGVEVSRFLVEGRYTIGYKNVLKAGGSLSTDTKSRSFAVLAGVRLN